MTEHQETYSFHFDYRHLAFFFVGAVAVCAFFFALGFAVGRAQTIEVALKQPEAVKNVPDADSGETATRSNASDAAGEESPTVASSQSGSRSETTPSTSKADYRKELDFYSTLKDQKVDQNFHPQTEKPRKASQPTGKKPLEIGRGDDRTSAKNGTPRGLLISLQVAALKSSSEAEKLAKTLRAKGYPVFTLNPAKDDSSRWIRVQVGPFSSEAEAAKTKTQLGSDGFAAITKR